MIVRFSSGHFLSHFNSKNILISNTGKKPLTPFIIKGLGSPADSPGRDRKIWGQGQSKVSQGHQFIKQWYFSAASAMLYVLAGQESGSDHPHKTPLAAG
jgi:hypothetical protein